MNALLCLQGYCLGSSLDNLVILLGIEYACLRIVVPLQIKYVL